MKVSLSLFLLVASITFASQIAVDLPPMQGTDADWLRYDDGTAGWITWGGMYRGVWFDMNDFAPDMRNGAIYQSELWFYHDTNYCWDIGEVYVEIWDGPFSAPVTRLDKTMITATHYAAVYVTYATPLITTNSEFWAIANTELSMGGWPSILGDGTPGTHSFFSDDLFIWESWGDMGDYFIALEAGVYSDLDNVTWGSLKAVF